MESWLSILAEGRFETPIAELVLRGRDGQRYEGSGRVIWTSTDGIRLHAATEIVAGSNDSWLGGGPNYTPGKVISHRDLLMLEGRTQDNWALIGDYVTNNNRIYDMANNQINWDVPIWTMKFHRPIDSSSSSPYLAAVIKPIDVLLDTLKLSVIAFPASFGHVTVTKGDRATCCISIATETLNCDELEGVSDAVCRAIAFVEGKAVACIGYEAVSQGYAYRKAYGNVRLRTGARSQPLPSFMIGLQHPVTLLQKATEFFNTKRGIKYSDFLRMCWDCVDCYGSIQAVTSCAMLESLLGLADAEMHIGNSQEAQTRQEVRRTT